MSDFGVSRPEEIEVFSLQLEDFQPRITLAASIDEEQLVQTINAASGTDGELIQAFFAFIAGKASDSQKELLAQFFAVYGKGWKLDNKNVNGTLLQRDASNALGTVTQEVCRLFLEEQMVVSSMIEDLSS